MDRVPALALISRIESTWSNQRWPGALVNEWTDVLQTLDEGAAGTAFVRLRNQGKPTIAIPEFIGVVRSLTVDDPGRREPCTDCDGTGWLETTERVWDDGRTSSQYKPCPHCPDGQQRAGSRVWTERNPTSNRRPNAA